jgi:hypothetical protein
MIICWFYRPPHWHVASISLCHIRSLGNCNYGPRNTSEYKYGFYLQWSSHGIARMCWGRFRHHPLSIMTSKNGSGGQRSERMPVVTPRLQTSPTERLRHNSVEIYSWCDAVAYTICLPKPSNWSRCIKHWLSLSTASRVVSSDVHISNGKTLKETQTEHKLKGEFIQLAESWRRLHINNPQCPPKSSRGLRQ